MENNKWPPIAPTMDDVLFLDHCWKQEREYANTLFKRVTDLVHENNSLRTHNASLFQEIKAQELKMHVSAGLYADSKTESHRNVIESLLHQLELKDKEIAMLQANITNISKP